MCADPLQGKGVSKGPAPVAWPPAVLLAISQELTRQNLRHILRNCGVRHVSHRYSALEVLVELHANRMKWQVLFIDANLTEVPSAVKYIREKIGKQLKIVLLTSNLSREKMVEAIDAGINDILVFPFSEDIVEKKLLKLTGTTYEEATWETERRRSARMTVPILIEAPSLSQSVLVPEEVSTVGFKVILPKRPEADSIHDISLCVADRMFNDCQAKLIWHLENKTTPATWTAGLAIYLSESEEKRLSDAIRQAFAKLNEDA